jgi:hypothetical protein
MATTDLLATVLPDEGFYCIVGLKKTSLPKQLFADTLAEVEDHIKALLEKEYDVYFGCAKYTTNKTRASDNVIAVKSFWLDIDCGENKPYETQADGLTAFKEFCSDLGLPRPVIVNSGRGLHVYWPLKESILRQQWKPIAEKLKAVCHERGLHADPSRTADVASILRVPETHNYKTNPPLDVVLVSTAPAIDLEVFVSALGGIPEEDEGHVGGEINDLTRALMGNKQNRFATIWAKTEKDQGCQQLKKAVKEKETIEEPLWRAALSVAVHCVDGATAIHAISEGHEGYDPEETERKAKKTTGPYTCDAFEKINPGGCSGCPHLGKLKSPITLGQEIIEADPEDNEVEFVNKEAKKPIKYTIPQYPFPYFRGKNGGVYRRSEADEDEEDSVLVYEHDLYVVKRLRDPQNGEVIWMRLHTPKDGVREFALPAVDLLTTEKLREKLAWYGVVALKKQMDLIMTYVVRFVKELQCSEEAEIMRTQFGWTPDNSAFVVGDTEICADSDRYSPPSSYTSQLAPWFEPKGSLEEWQSVIKVYGREGLEPHAFGVLSAFGAPFLKHMNISGCIINLINNESGTGKTTVLKAMHSVFGHPEELMLIQRDTMNVRLHRLGVMNTIGLGCDEVTKMKMEEMSDFSYAVSQGRGRGRMQANANAERLNFAKWQTILLCSSNASIVDKLKAASDSSDGEMMRVIEYQVPPNPLISKQEADQIFPKMYTNYGHAGRIYARDLVSNLEERIQEVKKVQMIIDKKVGFTNRERFWSAIMACNITGGLIARRLGLIDWDMGRIFKWAIKEFSQMREETKPPMSNHASVIGEFWNTHRQNTLVINDEADKRTGVEMLPILEPKGELIIRMEPDTQKLFIATKPFRNYCAENRITLKDVLNSLTSDGVYIGTVKKRLSKGTKLSSVPAVDALVFDCSRGDFIDPDAYIEPEEAVEEAEEAKKDES